MKIHEKLLKIQSELKAPKNQYNDFGKYNYRSCEDILEAVKPLCAKHGVALTISDTVKQLGDRYYIMATAILNDTETNEKIVVEAYAREEASKKGMDASQLTGSTSSYARKYALNGLFCIDDTKDSDSTNIHSEKNTPRSTPKNVPLGKCAGCGAEVSQAVITFCQNNTQKFQGKILCPVCQKK